MRLTENIRRYILLSIVAFIIIGVFTAKYIGNKQDEQFMYEEMLYNQASNTYQEGNFSEALLYINELLKLQPGSEAVNYLGALITMDNSEFKQASILFQKTLDLNPYKVEDSIFLAQYGEVLLKLKQYDDAKSVFEKSYEWSWKLDNSQEFQEYLKQYLTQIEKYS